MKDENKKFPNHHIIFSDRLLTFLKRKKFGMDRMKKPLHSFSKALSGDIMVSNEY
jgi:hypothetical protein